MRQRVFITGAGDGIGLGIAHAFLRDGAEVHVGDIREDVFDDAKRRQFAGCHVLDVASSTAVAETIGTIVARSGPLDVLINNVGIAGPHAFVEDISDDDWSRTMGANLNGAFFCIKNAVPSMKASGGGAILNISSIGTYTLPPLRSVYNTSKWAIEGLTKSLARELGPFNINCNAILPGIMNNARMLGIMERRATHEKRDLADIKNDYLKYAAMGRLIEPDEIGGLAVFLAARTSRAITAQLIAVSGGAMYED